MSDPEKMPDPKLRPEFEKAADSGAVSVPGTSPESMNSIDRDVSPYTATGPHEKPGPDSTDSLTEDSTPEDSDAPPAPLAPLAGRVAAFPHLPGVYIFKDSGGGVLYVGKARDLRKRISNYFRAGDAVGVKTRIMLGKAAELDYQITPTEKEALLLEASLIKKHRPRYNVVLRDDKNYPAIRIDPREPYPRLDIVRRFHKDGALYFGPYSSAHAVRETLKYLHQIFPLRLCKGKKLLPRERPCLNYPMGQCLGACAGKISEPDYRKMVEEVILFLEGKTDVLQQQLRKRMEDASDALEFEKAAFYRDRLRNVAATLEKQHVVSDRFLDQDVLGIHQEEDRTELVVLFIRQGVHSGQRAYDLKEAQGEPGELISAFIQQYYYEGNPIPDEILVPIPLESETILSDWLSETRGKRVRIWAVKRGERKHLLEMAQSNARERFISRKRSQRRDTALLESLQRLLKLPGVPDRIACVDISNLQGQHAVGAVVVFEKGHPHKDSYRRYRIRLKSEPDDPAMMAEVVERLLTGDRELAESLDLLMLDGGKGQLNRILHLMGELQNPESRIPLISLAKERDSDIGEKGKGLYEKIYLPGRKNPLFLHRFPDILHLLQRVRDEAHRFAISHYQSIHRTALLTSALDSIPGIGPKRRQMLLQHFGSMEDLQESTLDELESAGLPRPAAENVIRVLAGVEGDGDISGEALDDEEDENAGTEKPLGPGSNS
jgi:excinuclease ABC subunit C